MHEELKNRVQARFDCLEFEASAISWSGRVRRCEGAGGAGWAS